MYKVSVLSNGKYHNVETGCRYTLTKRAAKKFIDLMLRSDCEIEVFKFIYCANGVYCWSDDHDLYNGIHYLDNK